MPHELQCVQAGRRCGVAGVQVGNRGVLGARTGQSACMVTSEGRPLTRRESLGWCRCAMPGEVRERKFSGNGHAYLCEFSTVGTGSCCPFDCRYFHRGTRGIIPFSHQRTRCEHTVVLFHSLASPIRSATQVHVGNLREGWVAEGAGLFPPLESCPGPGRVAGEA